MKRLILALSILTAACGSNETATPGPAAMATAIAAATRQAPPTSTSTATVEVAPSAMPTVIPIQPPAPAFVMLTLATDAFCRKGPGVQYADVGSINAGAVAQADARSNTVPRWWWVLRNAGGHCWVSGVTVQSNAQAELLPIQAPEYALPQTPPDLWADRVCNLKKGGFAVTLNWTPSATADGYYVYANGELIQQIKKATRTSYVIKLPTNQPVTYGMQAYNDVGAGDLISFDDAGCP